MADISPGKSEAVTGCDVRVMYEAYPYPSPIVGDSLIEDLANGFYSIFGDNSLEGMRIVDAGCGTGQRLLAVARRYPGARFVGLDMTPSSIEVARSLQKKHEVENVEFHVTDLLEVCSDTRFDIVLSIGVVHHLEDPCRGFEALVSLLAEGGVLVVWLYHALGEHQRLLDRETLLAMWDRATGFKEGLKLLQDLGLQCEVKRYGSTSAQDLAEVSQQSLDVDAYLHPIVNAYRFGQAIELLRRCADLNWCAVNNINLPGTSRLVDLGEVEQGDLHRFCQKVDELFDSAALRQRYRKLNHFEKLQVMENRLKPTGFTLVAGRREPHHQLSARVRANILPL